MMNNIYIIIIFTAISLQVAAQRKSDLEWIKNAETKSLRDNITRSEYTREQSDKKLEFLRFYIPSSILFSGIEPAAVSKLNLGFGEDKVEFKIGKVIGKSTREDLDNSIALFLAASSSEGTRTIYQFSSIPTDFEGAFGYTHITKHEENYLKPEMTGQNKVFISRSAQWLNIKLTMENSKKVIFEDESNFTSDYNQNMMLNINYNFYFNGWYKELAKKRHIASLGLGWGHFDNYGTLDDFTLHKGSINPETGFFGETESVTGKIGDFVRKGGMLISGAVFYPISKFDALTNIMLGANLNSFGIGGSNHYLNGNVGFYISKRSFETDEKNQEQLKEDFSIAVLTDFSDLTTIGNEEYYKNNFKVILAAQIPLRFLD